MKNVALLVLIAGLGSAQEVGKKVEFEVASIRAVPEDGHHTSKSDNGLFRTHNVTLKRLIAMAYQVDRSEIFGGPNWLDTDGFDINAKIPDEFAQTLTGETLSLMIQSLLAERFQLVIHREPREISAFALVVTKKGPKKMTPATGNEENPGFHEKNWHLIAEDATMDGFAEDLSRNPDIGKPVVDETGLTGKFNFELTWAPERPTAKSDSSDSNAPAIFTALQEQLGLKLESAKLPISTIVIDRAEKPEGN